MDSAAEITKRDQWGRVITDTAPTGHRKTNPTTTYSLGKSHYAPGSYPGVLPVLSEPIIGQRRRKKN